MSELNGIMINFIINKDTLSSMSPLELRSYCTKYHWLTRRWRNKATGELYSPFHAYGDLYGFTSYEDIISLDAEHFVGSAQNRIQCSDDAFENEINTGKYDCVAKDSFVVHR